jgi:soluble lytic murein transglycosylase
MLDNRGLSKTRALFHGVLVALAVAAGPARADGLAYGEIATTQAALSAAAGGNALNAVQLAASLSDPVARKLVFWRAATQPQSGLSFDEIAAFVGDNPDWPSQTLLRQRAEEVLNANTSDSGAMAFFQRAAPVTGAGADRMARILAADGRDGEAARVIRTAWVDLDLTENDESLLYVTYWQVLTPDDHRQRLDRLLWQGKISAAQRMLDKVDPDYRAVGDARIQLRRQTGSPAAVLPYVPVDLQNDPGLIYETARWYRKSGYDFEARQILASYTGPVPHADVWWEERALLARRALEGGMPQDAYAVLNNHGLTSGADFADAEWLSGWIALRHLNEPRLASEHFTRMTEGVTAPISRARAAYWAGRASDVLGRRDETRSWYRRASGFPTAFYGQLAASALGNTHAFALPPDPLPTAEEQQRFETHDLVRAVNILIEVGDSESLRPFLLRLVDLDPSAGWKHLAGSLAQYLGRPDLAIAVTKRATRDGHILPGNGYPVIDVPENGYFVAPPEPPLVLAIVRQESSFDANAVSSAGARGLMQLMPATARQVASNLNLSYSPSRLTSNPEYNLQLGQAYFGNLLDSFSGSYVLSIAGYNAGPSRVRRWLQENGDPRGDLPAAIDWIERIPFSETRNYVQRTIENLQVYRAKLYGPGHPLQVENDLIR